MDSCFWHFPWCRKLPTQASDTSLTAQFALLLWLLMRVSLKPRGRPCSGAGSCPGQGYACVYVCARHVNACMHRCVHRYVCVHASACYE